LETSHSNKTGGLSLRTVSIVAIAASLLIVAVLLYVVYNASAGIARTNASMDTFTQWYQSAHDMQSASDYLSRQVQSFVVTKDPERMRDYFEEAEEVRRREAAIDSIPESFRDTVAFARLNVAMEESIRLMGTEYYAMALVCDAIGYAPANRPETLRAVTLSASDAALPAEEKIVLAHALVFSDDYLDTKETIRAATHESFEELVAMTKARQDALEGTTLRLLTLSKISILVLALLLIAILWLLFRLAIRPILSGTDSIKENRMIPVFGSKEFRHLATEYNILLEATRNDIANLNYEVVHDELTGLYNRAGYEMMKKSMNPAESAILIIDIDRFKSINDTYGHGIGDRALCRVADVLRENFRGEDRICRIGGDEMAVLMQPADESLRPVIEEKTRRITAALNRPDGDVPSIALSVGVAFGDGKSDFEDLFRHADRALYEIKAKGGNTCAFYQPKSLK